MITNNIKEYRKRFYKNNYKNNTKIRRLDRLNKQFYQKEWSILNENEPIYYDIPINTNNNDPHKLTYAETWYLYGKVMCTCCCFDEVSFILGRVYKGCSTCPCCDPWSL